MLVEHRVTDPSGSGKLFKMSESFAELFEESAKNLDMRPGMIVTAEVVEIGPDMVVVDADLKSEGIIPLEQFRGPGGEIEVEKGDKVEVAVEALEDGFGETKLSREKAKRTRSWEELEKNMESNETVKGTVTGKVKGGFTVELSDIRAFLPASLVDVRPIRDPSYLEGKDFDFKLIKLDQKRNNVVVSRRAVVESEYSEEREQLLSSMEEGKVMVGVIKNLIDYGAFVDLGGVDGLLHITDMAWKRVKHPSEIVEVGQEVEVKVLKFDKEKSRVSLGLKQLGDDPWINLARRYPEGTRLFGKVTNIADYGCFVEIEEGIEGLVHVSEMDWTNKNVSPSKVVTIGEEVEVSILDIDEERRRISLGMKQCRPNPWDEFAATHNKGDTVSGQIKSITDFGIFIGLPGRIDGLVHLSDISWNIPGEEAVRNYKKGQQVEAVVIAVDSERERISLGIKQMNQDPFSNYVAANPKGSIVTGRVKEIDARAVTINLSDSVEGQIRISEISRNHIEDIHAVLDIDDEIKAKFMAVDRKNRVILLSIKAMQEDEESAAVKEYATTPASSGTASLGDFIKDQIGDDKE